MVSSTCTSVVPGEGDEKRHTWTALAVDTEPVHERSSLGLTAASCDEITDPPLTHSKRAPGSTAGGGVTLVMFGCQLGQAPKSVSRA